MITAFKTFLSSDREKQLEKENSELSKALRDKDRLLTYANETVKEIRSHRPMSDVEWAMFKNQTTTIADLQGQLDQLALWLRHNKKAEIASGMHTQGLVKTIIGYLAQGTKIPVKVVGDGEKDQVN